MAVMSMPDPDDEGPLVRLDEVKPGRSVKVVHIKGRGLSRRRLLAVGMVPGSIVEVLRKAPLDDPVEYRVKGVDYSIRSRDAHMVEVRYEEV
jgi:ferrous iron transport protein A